MAIKLLAPYKSYMDCGKIMEGFNICYAEYRSEIKKILTEREIDFD